MKNKKGNIAVIAVIIVVVAITAGLIGWMFAKKSQPTNQQQTAVQPVSQKSTSNQQPITQPAPAVPIKNDAITTPANWKTYSSAKFGFGFDFPSNWYVVESPEAKAINIQNAPGVITLDIAPKDFKSFFITYDQEQIGTGPEPTFQTLSINGIQVKLEKDTASGAIWTIRGTKYETLFGLPNPSAEEIDVINKVVHTLKPVN